MKHQTKLLPIQLLIAIVLLVSLPVVAQQKADKIDALIKQYVANRQFNGTVLVAEQGKVIFKKGYGMANMEWNIPNTPDTKFRLGSITKQFTSMLIMQLVEKGKIKLDGKVTDYVPEYPKATGDKVTIHHLLTHTSGIPSYTGFPGFFEKMSRDPYTPDAFVKKFSDMPLEFEPGSTFSYDNSGYFLLGVIIEKVTGKSYADVLQENILKPLQLLNTGYDLADPIIPKRASGYEKRGGSYVNAPYLDMTIPYAAGSMYSTVDDLYRWDQALYTEKLLSAKSKTVMFTPFLSHYAYGWGVSKAKIGSLKDSLLLLEHTGGINGFNTIISRIPKDKQLVVLLNNTGGAPLGSIRKNILNILYDQPVEAPKKPIADALRQPALTDPLDKLRATFMALKADKAYSLSENELNGLGYELLGDGKVQQAINVFTLNVESFPQSFNVYDSRGEAYMKLGDKAAAIRDYKKSLELNPRNTGGIDKLKELGEIVDAPKDATVDEATLESYVGTYQLAPTFAIVITREGNKLFGQATGQQRFELFPESQTKFYLKVVEAKVSFVRNEKGEIDQLILHQNGRDMPGKRVAKN
ncbi:serine hydrolase [Spirosoma panaciterrae]|uniref:serine hydrolase n=1 Tax=Spirosoma panaciterrae TaxID=496058 RepID=UPI00035E9F8A|nr:serine hydrolase [Spirosoma panaciterrae]